MNPINLFGFQITRKDDKKSNDEPNLKSFSPPTQDDGAVNVQTGSYYGTYVDLDGVVRNEIELVTRYREMSMQPELETAIDEIVNEAIVADDSGNSVEINLDDVDQGESVKKKIKEEFEYILKLLDFGNMGHDIFRRWYIDGRMFYHIVIDEKLPAKGVQQIRYIDPRRIRKIREIQKAKDAKSGMEIIKNVAEYYLYNERGVIGAHSNLGTKIATDSIVNVNSGLMDAKRAMVLSYLHKAIKPLNQLRMVEDATVIYRLSRAPERRIFYIDVGNMPTIKAEQYVRDIMVKYRNKLVYDSSTGEIKDDRKHLSMLEDFWLPRREGGKGTEITTLPGGCLSMDTKVSLLDGRELSIREIENEMKEGKMLWTYSCHPLTGKIVPGIISWAGVTQESAKVMKLTLDNGEEIICTPDHKFPVWDKGFVRADELVENESMIPLYKKTEPLGKGKNDYEMVFDNEDKEWKFTHRIVADNLKDDVVKYHVFDESYSNGKYEVRHHKNFNRFDNSPENLCWMAAKDHIKLHSEKSFPPMVGTLARMKQIEEMKKNDTEEYKAFQQEISARSKEMWENYSDEEYKNHCDKQSVGIKQYIENLSSEDRKKRAELCRKNYRKGSKKYAYLLENDVDFRNKISEIRKNSWTDDRRKVFSIRSVEINKERWYGENAEQTRQNHIDAQKIEVSHEVVKFIIDLIKDKTTHQFTKTDVVEALNSSEEMKKIIVDMNKNKKVPNWNVSIGFTENMLPKIVSDFGYKNWVDFRKKEGVHNHRIAKIEFLDEMIEVGTLTIDHEEKHHNYHTFALSCGIFTKNSNLGEMEDVKYFERKLYKAVGVPISRLEPQQGFSLGRSTEITRDEIKFMKFIMRLRNKFSTLFDDLLRVQLVLKKVCTDEEWHEFREKIWYDFKKDNNFNELKEAELLTNRLANLQVIDPFVGRYYSIAWVKKNVLNLSDEEIEEIDKEMQEENAANAEAMQAQGLDPATGQPVQLDQQQPMLTGPDQQQAMEQQPEEEEPLPPKFRANVNEMDFTR